jgi:multiple sugar transport system substrate-binding protein
VDRLAGRLFLKVAVVVTAGAVAAGCGGPPGTQPWPDAAPTPGQDVTITILSGTDTSVSAGNQPMRTGEPGMYQQLADWWNRYEEPRLHLRIKVDVVPGGATVAHSQMLAAAQAGRVPGAGGADIYNLDGEWVPEFAAAGYLRPLQGHLATVGFLAKPLASAEDSSGRLYAAPFTTDVGLLYYRDDLATRAQVARQHTFNQLMMLAQAVRRPGMADYAGQFADYEGLTVNTLEIIHGVDRAAFAANGTVADPGAVSDGLQQLLDAFRPVDPSTPAEIPSAERTYLESQSLTDFATGHAVFMRNWPIYYEQLAAATGPGTSYVSRHFGVAPLPFPSVLGGQDLAIAASSPHPVQALAVIRFLTSAQAERCLFAVAGFPATRRSAYASGGALPAGYLQQRGRPLCGTRPGREVAIAPVILAGIATAIPRPATRYYTEFSTVIRDQVARMLGGAARGEVSVGDVVSAITAGTQSAATGRAPPAG